MEFQPPHFGGLWEAGVKSLKTPSIRTCGTSVFTFEEMATVLCRIEECLNARPLCPLDSCVDSIDALTPQHFLTSSLLINELDGVDLIECNINLLCPWEKLKRMRQEVCHRYKEEYLSRMLQRPKWCAPRTNVKVGQLVLVGEDNTACFCWPLGRVTDVHPGADGLVRVVTVKTKTGLKKRPITRIYPLPEDK